MTQFGMGICDASLEIHCIGGTGGPSAESSMDEPEMKQPAAMMMSCS